MMAGYGVGPWDIFTIRTYWEHLTMVAKVGVYHIPPFKCFRGVTHSNPLSPTILNLFINTVLRYWVTVVRGKEAKP